VELNKLIAESLDQYIKANTEYDESPQTLFQLEYTDKEIDEYIIKNKEKETFPVMLNRLREERNLTPKELYTRAWIDRRLYSQIIGERSYQPAKNTAIAFGLGLHLNNYDMKLLLDSAGLSLNRTSVFDLVISFCLEKEIFDISTVNQLLFYRKLPLLR
jgi:hypothetical protein